MGMVKNSRNQGIRRRSHGRSDKTEGKDITIQDRPRDENGELSRAERIWQVVAQIPTCRVISYGDVAQRAGLPGYARFVGTTLGKLPKDTGLPWHRVVNAQGRISMSLSREGSDWIQRDLLLAEGIPVDAEGRLPLRQFLWHPDAHAGD